MCKSFTLSVRYSARVPIFKLRPVVVDGFGYVLFGWPVAAEQLDLFHAQLFTPLK
jgi:hypothetical protein